MKHIFLIALLLIPYFAQSTEVKKEMWENYPIRNLTSLKVNNQYGNITITRTSSNNVKVKAVITTDVIELKDTSNIYPHIKNEIEVVRNQLRVNTIVGEDMTNMDPVFVHYFISIPDTFDLDITNRYGDLLMFDVYGHKEIIVEYGKIYCTNLLGPDMPRSKYSLHFASIMADSSSDADFYLNSSEMQINNIKKADITSVYSYVFVDKSEELNCTSETDKYQIQNVNSLKIVGENTSCLIDQLNNYFEMELNEGELKVNAVASSFTDINLSIKDVEGEIALNPRAAYYINATMKFGAFSYPEKMELNSVSDFGLVTYNGQMGKPASNGSQIGIVGNTSNLTIKTTK